MVSVPRDSQAEVLGYVAVDATFCSLAWVGDTTLMLSHTHGALQLVSIDTEKLKGGRLALQMAHSCCVQARCYM